MPQLNDVNIQKTDITNQYPIAPTRSPLNVNSRGHSLEFEGKSHIKKPSQISMEDYENEEHYQNKMNFNQKEKSKIVDWLRTMPLALSKNFNLDIEPIL